MSHSLCYAQLESVTLMHEATVSLAEAHGALTGMLCVEEEMDQAAWLSLVFGEEYPVLDQNVLALLAELAAQTRQALADIDCSFDLFLPDDDVELGARALALSQWCQGFLTGLGYQVSSSNWPGECDEVLKDLVEISQLEFEECEDSDEEAFTEVSEFVRVGVQLIRGEFLHPERPKRLH